MLRGEVFFLIALISWQRYNLNSILLQFSILPENTIANFANSTLL